jgi:hypothetical protein
VPAKSKFTAATREKLLEVKRVGGPDTLACAVAGITDETLRRWLAKGRSSSGGTYAAFAADYAEAKAHPKVRALGLLYKKLPDSDSLLMKYVERQVEGYEPPMNVPAAINTGPTIIALQFQSGQPANPTWLDAEVIDAPQSPALGPGSSDPDQAAGS